MASDENASQTMDNLTALCKRRGFIFQSSEIYGGIGGFWDYGPLGVELKRNLKAAWWSDVVHQRDDMVGLDAAIIMNPRVWQASGHVEGFNDPLVDCRQCKTRYRADQFYRGTLYEVDSIPQSSVGQWLGFAAQFIHPDSTARPVVEFISEINQPQQAEIRRVLGSKRAKLRTVPCTDPPDQTVLFVEDGAKKYVVFAGPEVTVAKPGDKCPKCGGELTEPRKFNMMFKTHVGALEDSASVAYLRPETAQGIFCNYANVLDTSRVKLPFGIAQIGKAFRNEINPRNYTFRSREFEQMEIEFFCRPEAADEWYEYWRTERFNWYVGLGLTSDKLRLRDHTADELAHYAAACADIEYAFPFGVAELEGVANRTDFDLKSHQEASGKDMRYFDDQTKERFIPYVIEPSGGVDRAVLAFLCEAYTEDTAPDEKGTPKPRTVMRLHPRLAPIKVAVFPLVRKDGMPEIARRIHDDCRRGGLASFYDERGAVGRRYRRQDEAGTPFCVTVDGQTLADQTVTVRDRDSLAQERINASAVGQYVRDKLSI